MARSTTVLWICNDSPKFEFDSNEGNKIDWIVFLLGDMFNQIISSNIHMTDMVISLPLLNMFACIDSVMFGGIDFLWTCWLPFPLEEHLEVLGSFEGVFFHLDNISRKHSHHRQSPQASHFSDGLVLYMWKEWGISWSPSSFLLYCKIVVKYGVLDI